MQQREGFRTHVTPTAQTRRGKMVTMRHIPEHNAGGREGGSEREGDSI